MMDFQGARDVKDQLKSHSTKWFPSSFLPVYNCFLPATMLYHIICFGIIDWDSS